MEDHGYRWAVLSISYAFILTAIAPTHPSPNDPFSLSNDSHNAPTSKTTSFEKQAINTSIPLTKRWYSVPTSSQKLHFNNVKMINSIKAHNSAPSRSVRPECHSNEETNQSISNKRPFIPQLCQLLTSQLAVSEHIIILSPTPSSTHSTDQKYISTTIQNPMEQQPSYHFLSSPSDPKPPTHAPLKRPIHPAFHQRCPTNILAKDVETSHDIYIFPP